MNYEEVLLRLLSYGDPSSTYFDTVFGGKEHDHWKKQRKALMNQVVMYGFLKAWERGIENSQPRRFGMTMSYHSFINEILSLHFPSNPPKLDESKSLLEEIKLVLRQMTGKKLDDTSKVPRLFCPRYAHRQPPALYRKNKNKKKKANKKCI